MKKNKNDNINTTINNGKINTPTTLLNTLKSDVGRNCFPNISIKTIVKTPQKQYLKKNIILL
tara:strand:+ start:4166 stop:4351 length:186 start_codon:yes stop_codon:yes gene_type:complete